MQKKTDENQDIDLSHSMVHYLLTIHKLKEIKGYARVTDIAKDLHLTKGSVSTAINNLKKRDLVVEEEDSKFLLLTTAGHDEVHKILSSKTLLYYFLKDFVGVSEKIAENDACLMEHLISDETRDKFFNFMKSLAATSKFNTTLDLNSYKTSADFTDNQLGDTFLKK
jgi:DtxR family Mn-dependent transcriptional regulator